jgi:hypothetical protein
MSTDDQPTHLRVDPLGLRDAARHLQQRPVPPDLPAVTTATAGDATTAATVAAFTAAYHATATVLIADDNATAQHLHAAADTYPDAYDTEN